MRLSKSLIIGLGLLLAGCAGSPEPRYYMLTSVPGVAGSGRGISLTLVRLPPITDRPQFLLRTGPNSVDFLDFDRWAEPLDSAVPRILGQDLALRGVHSDGARRLYVTIDNFIAARGGQARLSGHWWLVEADGDAAAAPRHAFDLTESWTDGQAAEIASALSRLLGALADQLAV